MLLISAAEEPESKLETWRLAGASEEQKAKLEVLLLFSSAAAEEREEEEIEEEEEFTSKAPPPRALETRSTFARAESPSLASSAPIPDRSILESKLLFCSSSSAEAAAAR